MSRKLQVHEADPIEVRGEAARALSSIPSHAPLPNQAVGARQALAAVCLVALGHATSVNFDTLQAYLDQEEANAAD